jgi:predicted Zn-dependent protease
MPAGAIDVLTLANRRRKDRPDELMRQIRYDRALLYEQVGRKADARREMERLYAEAPGFPDLRKRLRLGTGDSG